MSGAATATVTVPGTALGISYSLSASRDAAALLRQLLPSTVPGEPARLELELVAASDATSSVAVRWRDRTAPDDVVTVPTGDEAEALLAALNETALRSCDGLTLHAGVLLGREGAVAFPGASGLGKTTLVTACLQAGFPLLSDEGLWLDEAGLARPYPRPLALDARSAALLGLPAPPPGRELLIPPAALGPVAPEGPHQVAAVLLLERRPGPVGLAPATAGEAVHRMLTRSFNHFRDPVRAVRSAAAAAGRAECLRVRYGEAPELAAALWQRYGWRR